MKFLVKLFFISLIFLCGTHLSCYADTQAELVNMSNRKWTVSEKLWVGANVQLSGALEICNQNSESAENKRNNRWSAEEAYYYVGTVENGNFVSNNGFTRKFNLSFDIKEKRTARGYKFKTFNNGQQEWYEGNLYYYVKVSYMTTSGVSKYYKVCFSNSANANSRYGYTSIMVQDNQAGSWQEQYSSDYNTSKHVSLSSDYKNSLTIQIGGQTKYVYDCAYIQHILIGLGCSAYVEVSSVTVTQQTAYGMVSGDLSRARDYVTNKNYSAAATLVTTILETYKGYAPYLIRGEAYMYQEYYKSAIEDFSKALSYANETSQKEKVYFYRGYCKLMLRDDDGVNDMRNAGQDGIVFLRENDLLDYYPQSNRNNSTNTRSGSSQQNRKPSLTK